MSVRRRWPEYLLLLGILIVVAWCCVIILS